MKFSVLLPTRNRLEYLRYAIESVRRQDYPDWEIVVSDNNSEDDISGYVKSLDDPRILYLRTRVLVPVTENWNNALAHSDGDFVVMLGDDDGLLPNYFSRLLKVLKDFPDPDFVYLGAYFFAYPGAIPNEPTGFLREDHNDVIPGKEPRWLDAGTALRIARGYLDFRMPVASNMQFSLICRRMIDKLSKGGPFFRSPFPDFYATPLLFLRAERILVWPQPLVVVGITPKSYGAFHFSNRSTEGASFLANGSSLDVATEVRSLMLPGTSYNDSWLLAMEALKDFDAETARHEPNYRRYRFLQILHCYKARYFDRSLTDAKFIELRARMSVMESLRYGLTLPSTFVVLRVIPLRLRARIVLLLRRVLGQHLIPANAPMTPGYLTLIDVYDALEVAEVPPIKQSVSPG